LGGPKKAFGANEISSANLLADLRGSNLRSWMPSKKKIFVHELEPCPMSAVTLSGRQPVSRTKTHQARDIRSQTWAMNPTTHASTRSPVEYLSPGLLIPRAPFGCADKSTEKHCWLICYERKILFRLKISWKVRIISTLRSFSIGRKTGRLGALQYRNHHNF
jgi:hypothetical protein